MPGFYEVPTRARRIRRGRSSVEWLDIVSFLVFLSMNAYAIAVISSIYWFFSLLVLIDAVGTLFSVNLVVSLDRSIFAFLFVIFSATILSFDVLYLILEILALVTLLDFSFLLRRASSTNWESAVLKRRLSTYAETVVPSFFLSYAVVYLYSFIPELQNLGTPIFALSSVGAIFVILVMVRLLSLTFTRRQATKSF